MRIVTRLTLMSIICVATPAYSLDPTRILTQYGHTAWRTQDGVVPGAATSFAQTNDGYVWVGTRNGLLRFSGADLVPFKTSTGEPVRSPRILALLADRDGSLWIGTGADLEHWDHDRLIHYPADVGYILGFVQSVRQARDGQIWIGRTRVPTGEGPMCRVVGEKLECFGQPEGVSLPYVKDMLEDGSGGFWMASDNELIYWSPESQARKIDLGDDIADGIQTLAFDRDGALLVGTAQSTRKLGLSRLQDGRLQPFVRSGFDGRAISVQRLFVDSNRDLWIGTLDQGLYRISGEGVDHYRDIDGLSSNSVNRIFEDREGNIWVATQGGIDRFRDIKVASYTTREGLSADQVNAVVASRDGSVWISNYQSLDVLRDGVVTSFRAGKGLPGNQVTSLFEDRMGRMWVGVDNALTLFENGKFRPIRRADGSAIGPVTAIMDDPQGNLWVIRTPGPNGSVLRIANEAVQQEISFEELPFARTRAIASDIRNGVWLPMLNGDVAHWHDGHAEVIALNRAERTGNITDMTSTPDGSVYASAAVGVAGIRGRKWQSLDAKNGLPCQAVRALQWNATHLWLYADCGLLSVSFVELERWWRDPKARLEVSTLDAFDGVQPAAASWFPTSARSPDGRLWFANSSILQMFDPTDVVANRIAPLVQIERVVADRLPLAPREGLQVPALTRSLAIDYTASSYTVPQKVRFRYQLEGYDDDWQEAGNRRSAFYTGLPPGTFRFRVIACNNDGVWNTAGASLAFEVMPAFYQTRWFIVLCIVVGAAAIGLLYLARVRRITSRIRLRHDERMKERERIARDLHDTLLQGVQGLVYQFQAATERLPDTEPVRATMEEALDRADDLIAEGRDSLSSLRGSEDANVPLEEALQAVANDLAKGTEKSFHASVLGSVQPLHPIAREELFRIGSEALTNAFTHALASRIEMDIVYDRAHLLLRVRDDGCGFDLEAWKSGSTHGHFGLIGMQERASRLRSHVELQSRPGGGTKVTVSVRAETAYLQRARWGLAAWVARLFSPTSTAR